MGNYIFVRAHDVFIVITIFQCMHEDMYSMIFASFLLHMDILNLLI